VPASREEHILNTYQRLRAEREAQTGRPVTTQREAAQLRREAEAIVNQEAPAIAARAAQVRQEMLARARTSTSEIAGQTPEGLVRRAIVENPNITDYQILAMGQLRPEQVASSPDAQRRTLEQVPNARELPSHRFTVDMLHAITGIDRETLSRNGPDLGITGSADTVWPGTETPIVFHAPPTDRERLSTSLHDVTDTMRYAGVPGVNNAVWGTEGQVPSAVSSLNGVPQEFLDQSRINEGDGTVRGSNADHVAEANAAAAERIRRSVRRSQRP
jgi:hypothetical protein